MFFKETLDLFVSIVIELNNEQRHGTTRLYIQFTGTGKWWGNLFELASPTS